MRRSLLVSSVGVAAGALSMAGLVGASAGAASHPARAGHQETRAEVLRAVLAPSVPADPAIFGAASGGAPWRLTRGQVILDKSGRLLVDVHGLVLTTTRANPVPDLAASLYCGGTLVATTAPVRFSAKGNARIRATVSVPAFCPAPAVLLNPATGHSPSEVKTTVYIGFDGAGAAPATGAGKITIYSSPNIHLSTSPESANGITAGPDGALWFTNPGNNTIGRITTLGKVTDYTGKGIANTWVITAGPDRALWAGNWDTHSISRITTAGKVTTFPGTANTPTGIAAGLGYLWYTNWAAPSSIGRITTSGTSTSFTAAGVVYPQSITQGSDGAMWFIDGGVPGADYSIGRITKSGAFTFYPLADYPGAIAAGSDGALWFTYPVNHAIGRITTQGALSSFTGPGITDPGHIAAGPDGALWFTETNAIGRITTNGQMTTYAVPGLGTGTGQADIAAGPDGAMWFTNPATNTIGRITTSVTH